MKKILLFVCLISCLWACKEAKTNNNEVPQSEEQTNLSDGSEYEKNGRYCIFREPVSISSEDGKYHVIIKMHPDLSLPSVKNESFGRTYCDNVADVCVMAGNDTLMSRQFKKDVFSDYVDNNIASRAILNRITCRGFSADGVKLEAEISVPHSDEECYVTILVNRDGTVTMKRYESEDVPTEIVES